MHSDFAPLKAYGPDGVSRIVLTNFGSTLAKLYDQTFFSSVYPNLPLIFL